MVTRRTLRRPAPAPPTVDRVRRGLLVLLAAGALLGILALTVGPVSQNRALGEFLTVLRAVASWTGLPAPSDGEAEALATAILDVKAKIFRCSVCNNMTDIEPCAICSDPRRDPSTIVVVEEAFNIQTIEQTRTCV